VSEALWERETPAVLAPAALAGLAAAGDNRVPVAVGLLPSIGRDLEGKGDAVLDRRTAVDAKAGNSADRELDGKNVAPLPDG
jgi:hypothetical protein